MHRSTLALVLVAALAVLAGLAGYRVRQRLRIGNG